MRHQHRPRPTWTKRLILTIIAMAAMLGMTVVATPTANATVFNSCTISGCADAASANSIWQSMGYPSGRGWYDWPDGRCNFAGGQYFTKETESKPTPDQPEADLRLPRSVTFGRIGIYRHRNNDGQLPSGDSFQEFDVYSRACGAHRDAVRIVVDTDTGVVWFSPDHYSDFYQL